jgi:hypothetical protein
MVLRAPGVVLLVSAHALAIAASSKLPTLPLVVLAKILLLDIIFGVSVLTVTVSRGGIKIFKALARLASNSKFLLANSEENPPKSRLC